MKTTTIKYTVKTMNTMKTTIAILTAALMVVAANPCDAEAKSKKNRRSTSMLTAALGTNLGFTRVTPVTGGSEASFINEINLRIKMLKVIGFDFNWNTTGEDSVGNGEIYSSNIRATALLYVVPTDVLSVYLGAGAGSTNFSNLFSFDAANYSYHAGAGMEIYVGKNLALTAEYMLLIPQVNKVVVSTQPLRLDESGSMDWSSANTPTAGDYISFDNFQITLGMKWFF